MNKPLLVWNRSAKKLETELVYGEKAVRSLYGNSIGVFFTRCLLTRPWISSLYGMAQSSTFSKRKILPFIKKFSIPMEEFEEREFANFNEFFIRKFRPGARLFVQDSSVMPAFCEARYFAFSTLGGDSNLPVKGSLLQVDQLIGDEAWSKQFRGGPALIARLCPTDYHRFHFPDSGKILVSYRRRGPLHSVNPLALQQKPDILFTNERFVTIMETDHFGKIAYVEVGALCVGRIVQTFSKTRFERGEEKGYFLFGASTVILIGENGRWLPDKEIVEQSRAGIETFVRLGEPIATFVAAAPEPQ